MTRDLGACTVLYVYIYIYIYIYIYCKSVAFIPVSFSMTSIALL